MADVALREFANTIGRGSSLPRYVELFHAIRRIQYGVTGERSAASVLRNRVGSCSSKHLLLRDLLRNEGYEAGIVTIHTYFNKAVPLRRGLPVELAQVVRGEAVHDFHHFVRLSLDGGPLDLDATWHDALISWGFPVNHDWLGNRGTIIASDTIREYPVTEDIAALKNELIEALPGEEREKRNRFFRLLTGWIDTLGQGKTPESSK